MVDKGSVRGSVKGLDTGSDKGSVESRAGVKQARTETPQKQGWRVALSILMMLAWVAVSVIASQVVVGYLILWIVGAETFQTPVVTTVYSALSYILAMVLVILVPRRVPAKNKNATKDQGANTSSSMRDLLGLRGWPTWTDIGLAPVGFVVQLILAALLVGLFGMLFPWFDVEQAQDVGYNVLNGGVDRIVAFLALVVIAPIAEEIIFRGWLYGKIRRKLSGRMSNVAGMILAIFLVSLLFGVIHVQWNVGVNVFAVSVVLCALREITGTIYAGMLVHMLKNGVAFYLLYVAGV